MTDWISRHLVPGWSGLALDAAMQGVLWLLLIGGIAIALRRLSASARHLVWALALLGLIGLPVLHGVAPGMPLPILPLADGSHASLDREASRVGANLIPVAGPSGALTARQEEPEIRASGTPAILSPSVAPDAASPGAGASERAAHEVAPASTPSRASSPPAALDLPSLAGVIWLAGALVCLLPYLVGTGRLRRLCRRARPAPSLLVDEARECGKVLGVKRDSRLLLSTAVDIPMTWGFLRPVILLPAAFPDWPVARRRAVLLHELAHIRRQDGPVQLLVRVSLCLHWFNPLAWVARSRLRIESERACDDLVLRSGSAPGDYARCLLEVARSVRSAAPVPAAAIAMARPSHLRGRLAAILDVRRRRGEVSATARCVAILATAVALLPLAGLRLAADPQETVITVATDGSGRFSSIQEAVDAAAERSVIRIAPGVYDGNVTIRKPLTLEGAGWDRTTLTSRQETAWDDPELRTEFERRMEEAGSEAQRRAIRDRFMEEHGPRPTLGVLGAREVVLKELKLTLRGRGPEGKTGVGAVVALERAGARLSKCAIAGSPAHGIVVTGRSDVEIRECLVAGAWGTGILVDPKGDRPGRVRIADSEIRNCRHRGIQIGRGGDSTVIERCRITGSDWHGVRYDSASPTIIGNLFFGNLRSGIYASGRTAATVENNLFHGDGVTCWFQSGDTIQRNTFAGIRGDTFAGDAQGVSVLGASRPQIRKNIFFDNATGVLLGNIGSDSPFAKSDGKVFLEGNIFWRNDRKAIWRRAASDGETAEEVSIAGEGNVEADPGFADAGRRDFSLPPDSAARRLGVGAAVTVSFDSPWPAQPEESAVIGARTSRSEERAAAASRVSAHALAKPWIADILQIRDRGKRDAAVERVRAALTSEDPEEIHAGLIAFTSTLEANYDRASFRELVLPLVRSTRGEAQVAAFYALYNSDKRSEDLELVLTALDDEPSRSLRHGASHLIMLYTDGKITGRAGEAVLDLLGSEDRTDRREAMRGIWGAAVTPAIERRLIELAAPGSPSRGDAIYFALSTLQNKSRDVLQVLLEVAQDADFNNWGRALWGLGHGVPEEHHAMVADFLIEFFEARGRSNVRRDCLRMLAEYGDASHLEALERFAANDLLGEELRKQAQETIARIHARMEGR